MVQLSLIILVCVILLIYSISTLIIFKTPKSLSATYYLLNTVKKGLGGLFVITMLLSTLITTPIWITISDYINPNFTPIVFIAMFSMIMVGFTPTYKDDDMDSNLHNIFAIIGVIAGILWIFLSCIDIIYVPSTFILIPIIAMIILKGWKYSMVFWLEIIAFFAIYSTLIIKILDIYL